MTATSQQRPRSKSFGDRVRELREQARQQAGASSARILTPTSVVTLEYNRQRLNLNVDEQRVITRVTCG